MTTPSHMPKHYEFVVKKPHKAAARIAELEAENKHLNTEINTKAEWNMRYFEQLAALREALRNLATDPCLRTQQEACRLLQGEGDE